MSSDEENRVFIREAMQDDEEVDRLTAELEEKKKSRHLKLEKLINNNIKKFSWKGLHLTIFRKGEKGLYSLKGKKKEDTNILSVDD